MTLIMTIFFAHISKAHSPEKIKYLKEVSHKSYGGEKQEIPTQKSDVKEASTVSLNDVAPSTQATPLETIQIYLDFLKNMTEPLTAPVALEEKAIRAAEILNGENTDTNSLSSATNNTLTRAGKCERELLLIEPTFDINILRQRQDIVKALLENQELFDDIHKALKIMSKNEQALFGYFKPEETNVQTFFNQFYFGSLLNSLNKNPWTMEARTRFGDLFNLHNFFFYPITYLATGPIATHIGLNKLRSFLKSSAGQNIRKNNEQQNETPIPNEEEIKKKIDSACNDIDETLLLMLSFFGIKDFSLYPKIALGGKMLRRAINGSCNPFPNRYKDKLPEADPKIQLKNIEEELNNPETFKKQQEIIEELLAKNLPEISLGDKIKLALQGSDAIYPTNNHRIAALAFTIGGAAAFIGFQAWMSYRAYHRAKFKKEVINFLHQRMIAVAHYIRSLQTIGRILQKHGLAELPEFAPLIATFKHAKGNFKKLIQIVNSSTFDGDEATIISLSGRVLAAHKLMEEVKKALIPAIVAASKIDVYLSTAKLYKEHQDTTATFCFVEYVDNADRPYVYAREFWNPFISSQKAITNTLEFGTNEHPNNGILTGPNTGGKTTTIKGLFSAILLSQTLGIAPAQQMILTPFSSLNCYLNITDDLGSGVSLFKAEVLRAHALIDSIRNLQPHEFSFTLMDEIFSGTSPQEGEIGALSFALELSAFPNSVTILATHYPRMTELETAQQAIAHELGKDKNVTRQGFKNYCVSMHKDTNGSWVRPFKVLPGISNVHVALDLLKEENVL